MSTWAATTIHVLFSVIQSANASMRIATIIATVRRKSTIWFFFGHQCNKVDMRWRWILTRRRKMGAGAVCYSGHRTGKVFCSEDIFNSGYISALKKKKKKNKLPWTGPRPPKTWRDTPASVASEDRTTERAEFANASTHCPSCFHNGIRRAAG